MNNLQAEKQKCSSSQQPEERVAQIYCEYHMVPFRSKHRKTLEISNTEQVSFATLSKGAGQQDMVPHMLSAYIPVYAGVFEQPCHFQ